MVDMTVNEIVFWGFDAVITSILHLIITFPLNHTPFFDRFSSKNQRSPINHIPFINHTLSSNHTQSMDHTPSMNHNRYKKIIPHL